MNLLSEQPKKGIDREKKNMLPLTKGKLKSHQDARNSYICGNRVLEKLSKSIDC